ncbi:oligopeptidase A, putative [Entamoeba invadens IP1]|uniref:Oligopeptidase A, putative n=1 Tax=Entamoeba invadens IP1 TaxID=370355 RepID=A0A0A1U778_ENTIV|nr:oligopeptidase A, putative [Entamoeba invadens IP1]ELP88862.1 oligopeptidase A, putative [Entamoeba invadens IP1]|eukprot:XP_004255633.1 oligopeptidase A, putative [Entamoeba invadens IP1]
MEHPFFQQEEPFDFSVMTADHIVTDVDLAFKKCTENLDQIHTRAMEEVNFENTVVALELATLPLDDVFLKIELLSGVRNDMPGFEKAYDNVVGKITEYRTAIFADEHLFARVEKVHLECENFHLKDDEKRLTELMYNNFVQGGAGLPKDKKEQFKAFDKKISELGQTFMNNLSKCLDRTYVEVQDVNELDGVPKEAIARFKKEAEERKMSGYAINMQAPNYIAVMTYCKDQKLRQKVFETYNRVCSFGEFDNSENVISILQLREEMAHIIGFNTIADFILKNRMAKNGENAMHFVEGLHQRTQRFFDKDVQRLQETKAQVTGRQDKLKPWDISFYINIIKEQDYKLDEEEFRKYFNSKNVLYGIFQVFKKMYSVTFKQKEVPVWADGVEYYEVYRNDNFLGSVYFDLFPRKGKRSGGYHEIIRMPHGTVRPVCVVVTNLTPPGEDGIAHFSHDEVETLFHECGHLIHTLLAEAKYPQFTALKVAWDFVELPSQIMENWTYEKEVFDIIGRYKIDGKECGIVPDVLYDKMMKAKTFMSAYYMMRQLSFGKMDLELHLNYLKSGKPIDQFIKEVTKEYQIDYDVDSLSNVRTFIHLFKQLNGYACAYYSYKWAEVLEADAFELFKEKGIFNKEVCDKFRTCVLGVGNAVPADVAFKNFRGREQNADALFKRNGLI